MAFRASIAPHRVQLGRSLMDGTRNALAQTGRLPIAQPERYGLERLLDRRLPDLRRRGPPLHVYRPVERPHELPVVLYVHGGGFRVLSKDTHWVMALALDKLGAECDAREYQGEIHAFHALVWRANAQAFRRDTHRFLDSRVPR